MSNEIKEKEEYEKYARDHRKELDAQEVKLGDVVKVVCLGKDKMGRFSFSMRDVAE